MNLLGRRKLLSNINMVAGDTIELTYLEPGKPEVTLIHHTVDDDYVFTEAVIFEAPPGELGEGRALGGALVESR